MSGSGPPRGRGTRGRGSQPPQQPPLSQQRPSTMPQAQAGSAPRYPPPRLPPSDPRPRPVTDAILEASRGDMSRLLVGAGDTARGARRARSLIASAAAPIMTKPSTVVTKQGKLGTPVALQANYFAVLCKADYEIYQYRVDFSDPEDRVRVMKAWLGQHSKILGEKWIFDGTMLFSTQSFALPDKPLTLTSFKKDCNSPVQITIQYTNRFDRSNNTIVQLFNLILRRCMGMLDLQLIGRRLFDGKAKHDIPAHKISIWPGYETSIRQHEDQFLLNCEFINKVMREDTAYDLLRQNSREFERAIVGTSVLTTYNNTMYRVDDIARDKTPLSTFDKNGTTMTFKEYYKQRYGITIQDERQPLLISRPKAKDLRGNRTSVALLIPELCKLTGLTDSMRANFQLMKAMGDVVHISPSLRMERLQTYQKRLLGTPAIKAELDSWGLKLDPNLVQVQGRQMAPETILFGRGVTASAGPTADWNQTSQNKAMLVNATLPEWFVITSKRQEQDTKNFIQKMCSLAQKMDFNMPAPKYVLTDNDSGPALVRAIDSICAHNNPHLLFVSVSNVNADRYSAIKKKCYIDRAISCQVVTGKVLTNRNLMTIASKVAIQINTKLGGAPWAVKMPNTGAMIVGFDVCHDPLTRSKSCGAMVTTANLQMTKYYSFTTMHTEGEELSNTLGAMILAAVRNWLKENGSAPNRIIVYRDGVGDGQIKHVYEHEVVTVKKALSVMYGEKPPVLTYIIVTKRINTRLFLSKMKSNPGPGVVVDSVVTLPEKYDFFLVSQTSRQGTVMPTCYNIIEDNSGWQPDQFQRLTFMLCHLYYNFSATVRVPAVVQYAHRLAFMVSQHLHGEPNPGLNDRLFFI